MDLFGPNLSVEYSGCLYYFLCFEIAYVPMFPIKSFFDGLQINYTYIGW